MFGLLPWMPSWAWRWIAIALVALSLFAFGWFKGDAHGTEKLTEYKAAQAVASAHVIVKQGAVTERVVNHYYTVAGATEQVVKYVDREVTKYEQSNPGLCLDVEWRKLHDTAAAGPVPKSGRASDGEMRAAAGTPQR